MGLTVVDTIATNATGFVNSSRNTVTVDGLNIDGTALTASSTPNVTGHAFGTVTMTAGAATLDLTAASGVEGATVSLSGLEPRAFIFENPSTNANNVTIAKGVTNGYTGLGASFSVTLKPGHKAMFYCDDDGTAVSGTDKTFDISGTGSQTLKYQVIAGT